MSALSRKLPCPIVDVFVEVLVIEVSPRPPEVSSVAVTVRFELPFGLKLIVRLLLSLLPLIRFVPFEARIAGELIDLGQQAVVLRRERRPGCDARHAEVRTLAGRGGGTVGRSGGGRTAGKAERGLVGRGLEFQVRGRVHHDLGAVGALREAAGADRGV